MWISNLSISLMSTLTIWEDIRGWVIKAWSTVRINRVGSGSELSILSMADANTELCLVILSLEKIKFCNQTIKLFFLLNTSNIFRNEFDTFSKQLNLISAVRIGKK